MYERALFLYVMIKSKKNLEKWFLIGWHFCASRDSMLEASQYHRSQNLESGIWNLESENWNLKSGFYGVSVVMMICQ